MISGLFIINNRPFSNMAKYDFKYPRRRIIRWILKQFSYPAFKAVCKLTINGTENLPQKGPLLVVGNHFSFIDPAVFVRVLPWPVDFLGGAEMPHAPVQTRIIPFLWGYYPLYRGTGSRYALKAAEAVLKQGGIMGIFPEGGNWATVLRPARPGAAFLMTRTNAQILPVGLHGLNDVFPALRAGSRAEVTVNIGRPFGPLQLDRTRESREQLDEMGHEIMRHIADLIPPEKRGHYSDDPAIRAAAQGTEIYPWADKVEGQVIGQVH
jgi:1-acyl-sn-glycerol-3-phosphate acyltransferase